QLRGVAPVDGVHRVEAGSVDALVDGPAVGGTPGAVQPVVVPDPAELLGVPLGGVGATEHVGDERPAGTAVAWATAVGERVARVGRQLRRNGEHVLDPLVVRLPGV